MNTPNSIQFETHNNIALIQFDTSDDHTADIPSPAEQLQHLCQSLNEDPSIRAIILTNSGKGFWPDNPSPLPTDSPNSDPEAALQRHQVANHVATLKVPTIATIQGHAWNQGLEIALACDLRLAADDTTFGFSSLASGFIPIDGGTQRLPRIIGRAHALDLLLTGRSLTASEALQIGLINALHPSETLRDAAIHIAQTIGGAAPIAVQYLKEAVHKGLDLSLTQGLNLEADLSFIIQTTKDRKRGIDSFLKKTTPNFTAQ